MTRKKVNKGKEMDEKQRTQTSVNFDALRWVNPHLNQQDIAWLESNDDDALRLLVELLEGLQPAQRLSCKVDARSGRWVSVLFDGARPEGEPTPALSVRGASAIDSLLALGYCALRKDGGAWQSSGVEDDGRFN